MSAQERIEPERRSLRSAKVEAGDETILAEWSVHLLKRDPRRAWGVGAAVLLAAAAGALFFHSVLFEVGGALLILSSSAEYLFPIRYRLTATLASCSFGLTRYEIVWGDVRRILTMPDGVELSPLSTASRLDAFRGVLIRFPDDASTFSRTELMDIITSRAEPCHDTGRAAAQERASV